MSSQPAFWAEMCRSANWIGGGGVPLRQSGVSPLKVPPEFWMWALLAGVCPPPPPAPARDHGHQARDHRQGKHAGHHVPGQQAPAPARARRPLGGEPLRAKSLLLFLPAGHQKAKASGARSSPRLVRSFPAVGVASPRPRRGTWPARCRGAGESRHSRIEVASIRREFGKLLGQHPGIREGVQRVGAMADHQRRLGHLHAELVMGSRRAQEQPLQDGRGGAGSCLSSRGRCRAADWSAGSSGPPTRASSAPARRGAGQS